MCFSLVWVLLFCFTFGETEAKISDVDKKKGKLNEHFYYALPQNYFTVTVKISKCSMFEGPLSDYAGKLTGLSAVIKEDAVHYSITEISLQIHSQVDLQQVYYVEYPLKNTSFRQKYKDLLIPKETILNQTEQNQQSVSETIPLKQQNRFSIYAADAMVEKYDTVYVSQVIDTLVVQVPKITKRLVAKPTQQQAQEAIGAIEKIREAYWLLISGDFETDFSNLERMLDELKQKENEYLALFGGVTENEEWVYTFTVIPSKQENKLNIPLFYFSEKQGITKIRENQHQMEYILKLNPADIHNAVSKANKSFMSNLRETDRAKANNEQKQTGLYYRNPHYYSVSLYNGANMVKNFGIYPLSQFGEVQMLPSTVYSFEIDPFTGALLYMETTK